MNKKNLTIGSVLLLIVILLCSACIKVQIVKNVKNPNRYFRRAMRQIETLERRARLRKIPAHSIHALVYERGERKLLKVEIPLDMSDGCLDIGVWTEEELDLRKRVRRRDVDDKHVRSDDDIKPGLAAQFKDEDTRVLVWYE